MKNFEGFKKGVDLGGWLSQCCHTIEHYDSFIKEEDIKKIASWGLDHVRLPIDYEVVEKPDGTLYEEGCRFIDNAVRWCTDAGLNIVLDVHKTAGYSFDKGEGEAGFFDNAVLQERFYRMWENLAERYSKHGKKVAFELLNEVTDKSFSDKWNEIIYICIKRIRAIAPDTVIITGGYWNNSPDALPDLVKPYDENVVLSFHCYDPMDFTHQGATWVEDMDPDFRKNLDRSQVTADYFAERFARAIETAEKYSAPLYCGEYGVIDKADPYETLEWYKVIHSAFERFDIAHSAWNYKEKDFGLSDKRMECVIGELINYL